MDIAERTGFEPSFKEEYETTEGSHFQQPHTEKEKKITVTYKSIVWHIENIR